jgi:hypothetical protein
MVGENLYSSIQLNLFNWMLLYRAVVIAQQEDHEFKDYNFLEESLKAHIMSIAERIK